MKDLMVFEKQEKPMTDSLKVDGMKCVYVLESSSGLVKIGVSQEFSRRKKIIESQSGHKITDDYFTDWLSNSYAVESKCHSLFSNSRVMGEWFDIPFKETVEVVKSISKKLGKSDPKIESKFDCENIHKELFGQSAEMNYLKTTQPVVYDFLNKNGYELKFVDNQLLVEGDDFEMSFGLFTTIMKKQLAVYQTLKNKESEDIPCQGKLNFCQ